METVRSFISIDIPMTPALLDITERLRDIPGISVPKDVHMTLRFLGDMDADRICELSERMVSLEKYSAFSVSLKGLGAFPGRRDPRVIWIGAELGDPFRDILSGLDTLLGDLSVDFDRRPFRAHVTVGRVKRTSERLADILHKDRYTDAGSFRCDSIRLMRSRLSPGGAEHSAIGTFELRGR
jgi:2'-5' RNA ligase